MEHGTPTWLPAGVGGQRPGWRVFVGDLAPHVDQARLRAWIQNDQALGSASLGSVVDLSVSGGAASGARKCILTLDSEAAARAFYRAIFRWWSPCPAHVEARGWRWLSVRYMER